MGEEKMGANRIGLSLRPALEPLSAIASFGFITSICIGGSRYLID